MSSKRTSQDDCHQPSEQYDKWKSQEDRNHRHGAIAQSQEFTATASGNVSSSFETSQSNDPDSSISTGTNSIDLSEFIAALQSARKQIQGGSGQEFPVASLQIEQTPQQTQLQDVTTASSGFTEVQALSLESFLNAFQPAQQESTTPGNDPSQQNSSAINTAECLSDNSTSALLNIISPGKMGPDQVPVIIYPREHADAPANENGTATDKQVTLAPVLGLIVMDPRKGRQGQLAAIPLPSAAGPTNVPDSITEGNAAQAEDGSADQITSKQELLGMESGGDDLTTAVIEPKQQREKKFKCNECEKAYYSQSHLKVHINAQHTGIKPYVCDICGKAYARSDSRSAHRRLHFGIKKFKCTFEGCDKAFGYHSHLQSHLKFHTKERPFKCEYCGKEFAGKGNYNYHIRTHTNDRPCKCEICGHGFVMSSDLKKHMRAHTGEKPYK